MDGVWVVCFEFVGLQRVFVLSFYSTNFVIYFFMFVLWLLLFIVFNIFLLMVEVDCVQVKGFIFVSFFSF